MGVNHRVNTAQGNISETLRHSNRNYPKFPFQRITKQKKTEN